MGMQNMIRKLGGDPKFQSLIGMVKNPNDSVSVETNGMRFHIEQDPPGVYGFKVTQGEDMVQFSAKLNRDGYLVKPLHVRKGDMDITPSQNTSLQIFYNNVVARVYDYLFSSKER